MWSADASGALNRPAVIAYFSMEVGLDESIPTYSGGLGVLAGDMLRAAADSGLPMVGVTLLYRNGHFRQQLDRQGNQTEHPVIWDPGARLDPLPTRVTVEIEGQSVQVAVWLHEIRGVSGHTVPVFFLDTALPDNGATHRGLTDHLYGGDDRHRLCQEAVLGIGGVAMLRARGFEQVLPFHMNEGHSALLTLALLEEQTAGRNAGAGACTPADLDAVRQRCVFTTHTPVAAGHDQFSLDLVARVLGPERTAVLQSMGCGHGGALNLTHLALQYSRRTNAVSVRHQEVSRTLFPRHPITSVTNGVHAGTWTVPAFATLYDCHIPGWQRDNSQLRYARRIPLDEIQQAHRRAKRALLAEVKRLTGTALDPAALTIGFARRATGYKRSDLIFTNLDRLRTLTGRRGPLQIVFSGKAHPRDHEGKSRIRRVFEAARALDGAVRVVYLEDYDMALGKKLCAGVDLWLNTPLKPHEASGTSGMKAALNGVPSLSVLDGWWVEGHIEGVTGWAIGDDCEPVDDRLREAASMYDKLEHVIMPMFYRRPDRFAEVMRMAIAVNGSFFNAQRMVGQYLHQTYQIPD